MGSKKMHEQFPLSRLSDRIGHKIDLFLCCASYEPRSVSIAASLAPGAVAKAVIFYNKEFDAYIWENKETLESLFLASEISKISASNPVETADAMVEALSASPNTAQNILIDITCFTHEGLLILLQACKISFRAHDRITLAYSAAGEYSVGANEEDKWLSKGVREIRSVLGYPGIISPGRGTHLIILLGFEAERAQTIIDEYEPEVVSVGISRDATVSGARHSAVNLHTLEKLSENYKEFSAFDFSCVDPAGVASVIEGKRQEHQNLNTVIFPMSTKLSAYGAAIACEKDPSMQIGYAQPEIYNIKNYSTAGDVCHVMELSTLFTLGT